MVRSDVQLDIEPLLTALLTGESFRTAFELLLTQLQLADGDLFDAVALAIARDFAADRLSFADADAAINTVWSTMVERGRANGSELPALAYAIYDAFDAGEYDHGDGADPVATYTRPAIRRILSDVGSESALRGTLRR